MNKCPGDIFLLQPKRLTFTSIILMMKNARKRRSGPTKIVMKWKDNVESFLKNKEAVMTSLFINFIAEARLYLLHNRLHSHNGYPLKLRLQTHRSKRLRREEMCLGR